MRGKRTVPSRWDRPSVEGVQRTKRGLLHKAEKASSKRKAREQADAEPINCIGCGKATTMGAHEITGFCPECGEKRIAKEADLDFATMDLRS